MGNKQAVIELHRIDSGMVRQLMRIEAACLAASGLIAAVGLSENAFPGLAHGVFPWKLVGMDAAVATAASTAALGFSSLRQGRGTRILIILLALVTALPGVSALAGLAGGTTAFRSGWMGGGAAITSMGSLPGLVATAFLLLAVVLGFVRASEGPAGYVADVALFGLGWIVLALVFGWFLGTIHALNAAPLEGVAPWTICALALTTFVAFARRAEYGHFSIFLGRGIGSRVARGVMPVLLALPLFRELTRGRMLRSQLFPEAYAAGFLCAAGTIVGLGILLLLTRQFQRLEGEIRDLSLRDELTGLYNLRGFQLLAGQALRVSQRSQTPFSVLFVDVDNLKMINDRLGHGEGSRLLIEAAEFLQTHFRETDVVGRIGGDEFAVAGHFSQEAIELAAQRMQARSRETEDQDEQRPRLGLSMGHVSADPKRRESLQELLDRADAAMYEQKRRKKMQAV